MGIGSLPVRLGVQGAAQAACWTMAVPQGIVVLLLLEWERPLHALAVALLLAGQVLMMKRFLADPLARALWLSGLGVPLYVLGMLASALALRSLSLAGA
jgi:chlorophyll synthase